MRILGIDLSSQPENTAVCELIWPDDGNIEVSYIFLGCSDDKLDELVKESDVVGIDAPFGWPTAFRYAVAGWTSQRWDCEEIQKSLRLRTTDLAVRERGHKAPLSVSSERIALPAMRAMALLLRHEVTDKIGDKKFFEVYPAGSLACWGLPCSGYKKGEKSRDLREKILNGIRDLLPELDLDEKFAENDHYLDALVAAITAKMASIGQTEKPGDLQKDAAKEEGWIHLPSKESVELRRRSLK
ncbi:MAG: DUF429 domain-containing protein [Verrucomicrobiaceae bacterium]|nr:MAG: DUF429 domain-containing protein [Verrucomicrobiaceae bacterium]